MSLTSTLNFELRSLTPVLTCLSYIRALNGHAGIACVQQASGNISGAFPQHMQSLQCITHGNVGRPFIICSVLAKCSTILWPAALLSFRDSAYTWQHFGQLVLARGLAPRDSEHGDRRLSPAAVFELLRPVCAAGQDSVFASSESLQQPAYFQTSSDSTERWQPWGKRAWQEQPLLARWRWRWQLVPAQHSRCSTLRLSSLLQRR